MSRTFPINCRVWLLSALTAAALTCTLPFQSARAAGFVYQQHTLNAGVLFPGSATDVAPGGATPSDGSAPYLFFVLNNRPDARPSDLRLINPQAPQTVTPALARRWGYAAGPVTQSMAGYWEVPLHDISSDQLHQYDVLYLAAGSYAFSPADNEKLRRFVDTGGQLIVEYSSAAGSPGLFSDTNYTAGAGTLSLPVFGSAFLRHPLLSQPYLLSDPEILALGTPNGSISYSNEGVNLFGPVVLNGTPAGIVAGQLGAGQIVVSALDIGGAVGGGSGANFASSTAPAQDLKFLSNLLSWTQTHPNEYKTSHGNAASNGLSAFSASWLYPANGTAGAATPPGAAVWGNFVFAMDSSGTLRAFDAYPAEHLLGAAAATADDAITAADTDYSLGKPYDQIWSAAVGANASAPTVAVHGGITYVFVEKADGSIVSYNAVTGLAGPAPAKPADATNYTAAPYTTNAPSPTYYDGRLYAGQENGSLSVYDLNSGVSVNVPLTANTPSGESVIGPPSVGLLPNGNTNVITAIVPTTQNMYTVLLGGRNEPLKQYNANGALVGYSLDRSGRYSLPNLAADVLAVPALVPYYSNGVSYSAVPTTTSPQDPLFAITDYNGFFTDWDTDFAASTLNGSLANLNFITAGTYGDVSSGVAATGGTFSAPAIDRHGDYYYTLNSSTGSYLVGVRNAPLPGNVQLKFRFRMPVAADGAAYKDPTTNANWKFDDADGVNYNNGTASLLGYRFVGAPAVDDLGNVYVVASNGSNATVLCFRGNQGASADTAPAHTIPGAVGTPIDLTQAIIRQLDEGSSTQTNNIAQGQTIIGNNGTTNTTGQYSVSTEQISFYNFGLKVGSPSQQISGNLTEPQPVAANAGPAATFTSTGLLLHTNLAWYVKPFPAGAGVTGLSKVGNTLFFTDGKYLYKMPAAPSIGAGKVVTAVPAQTLLNPAGTLGAVGAAPSIGGNVMIVNGANGIAALTRQVTVIADNNRVLGVDGDGAAIWSVDATTATNAGGGPTKVAFSHPVSLSKFADNQYLAADVGNNRCVRFDSGGNVQWELTRFSDPSALMAAGQPLTLSQPSSVQSRTTLDTSSANSGGSIVSYLIADTGNDRIVEVSDVYNAAGALVANHVLTWVSHTGDQYGRRYRYGSATYYPVTTAAGTALYIAATVTNTRLGKLAAGGALGSASSDAPGGSIVLFVRPATPAAFSPTAANDLIYTTPGFYAGTTPYTVRNPRFLSLYTPPTTASPIAGTPFSFLYADDNGAFDLTFSAGQNAFVAGSGMLQFTQATYDGMMTPVIGDVITNTTYVRANRPFVPTCVQRIDSDPANPRYLITQTFSQGELGTIVTGLQNKIGGEVFEIDGDTINGTFSYSGGFGNGSTLSHPLLTGPLTQPTFALRVP